MVVSVPGCSSPNICLLFSISTTCSASAFFHLPCFLTSVCGCKICHACECSRVLLSQYMLSFLYHHHLQHLSLLPFAQVSICDCKICHACECARVLFSQYM